MNKILTLFKDTEYQHRTSSHQEALAQFMHQLSALAFNY